MSVVTQHKAVFPSMTSPQPGVAFVDFVKRFVVNFTDLVAGNFFVPVMSGQWIVNVRAVILTAFDGGATIDIGDGMTADLFTANANITEGTVGSSVIGTAGKYFRSNGFIQMTVGGVPTVGEVALEITFGGYDQGKGRGEIDNT